MPVRCDYLLKASYILYLWLVTVWAPYGGFTSMSKKVPWFNYFYKLINRVYSKKGFTSNNHDCTWNPRCFWWQRVMQYGTQRFIAVLNGFQNGIRFEKIVHGSFLIFHPVVTNFAAWCSTCVQSVAKYVYVESSVEKVLQTTKRYKITSSTMPR